MPRHPKDHLVMRTLWRVESGLGSRPGLDDLARAEGVSRFHLARAFALVTGRPLMAYIKARRLAEAARALAAGQSVTAAALDAGYDSPEAFSRAFRRQFGGPPHTFGRTLDPGLLQEPFDMTDPTTPPPVPQIVTREALVVHGLGQRFTMADRARIPALWQRLFEGWDDRLHGVETYGICHDFDEEGGFEYFCGAPGIAPGGEVTSVTIPAGRYARFEHASHVASISDTWAAIFRAWQPESGETLAEGPEVEVYAATFDPAEPGGVAILIPLA